MKKIHILLIGALLCAGCGQEEIVPRKPASGPVFTAMTEEFAGSEDTKTVLGTDLSSVWTDCDQIAVFQGNSAADMYQLDSEWAGYSSGSFSIMSEGTDGSLSLPVNIAVYPYQESLSCSVHQEHDGEVVSWAVGGFSYPSAQTYQSGSFAEDSYVMAAVTSGTSDHNLKFKNVGGALKLQLTGNCTIASMTLSGNCGEKISGDSGIILYKDGSVPGVLMSETSGTTVVLDCGAGVQLSETAATEFFFALPPVTFEEGFTVEVECADGGSGSLECTSENTVGRSQILVMPEIAVDITPAVVNRSYVDEYGVNRGRGVMIDGVVWAPVNCGYKGSGSGDRGYPYGKMYQWGRNAGVGYSYGYDSTVGTKTAGGSVSIVEANAVEDSRSFYTRTDVNNLSHWFSDTSYDAVWNSGSVSDPEKSAYDPCPDGWRVPTRTELQSLTKNRSAFVTVDSQKGYWYSGTSAYSESEPAVFFPAVGWIDQNGYGQMRTSYGRYWASTVYDSSGTIYGLSFNSSSSNIVLGGSVFGCAVRCVADAGFVGNTEDGIVEVESIALSETSLEMMEGEVFRLESFISPAEASAEFVTWSSDNEDVASVDQYGNVYAYIPGEAVITVASGEISASCAVSVTEYTIPLIDYEDEYGENHGQGVLIDGIIWAPVNCGYLAPTDSDKGYPYGKLYQWARPHGFGYSTNYDSSVPEIMEGPMASEGGFEGYYNVVDSEEYSNVFITSPDSQTDWFEIPYWDGEEEYWERSTFWNWGTSDEPEKSAYDPCPEGWRLPSFYEMEMLSEYCSEMTTDEDGTPGCWFSGSVSYEDGVSAVFLPAAGFLNYRGECAMRLQGGRYWTSDLSPSGATCSLYFMSYTDSSGNLVEEMSLAGCCTAQALSVRCVQE